jgi:hypothetical protein
MSSDLSEPAVSPETGNKRMPEDMFGPLSDKPNDTTPKAQVTNTSLPAEQRPNKTPVFISGASNTCGFLAWLRVSCPGGLTAQLKCEKMMVVPATADGFRAVVSALRSLYGREGAFPQLHAPRGPLYTTSGEDPGRVMPDSVVREESCSCDPAAAIRTEQKTALPTPTSLSQWRVDLRCQKYVHSPNSADFECRWSRTWPRKAHCNERAASALDTRSVTADTRPGASRVAAPTAPVGAPPRENRLTAMAAEETTGRTKELC